MNELTMVAIAALAGVGVLALAMAVITLYTEG